MNSRTRKSFWRHYTKLPRSVQGRAKAAYQQFVLDPNHPGLKFKHVHPTLPLWSVRITASYGALGFRTAPDTIVWFFIGTHAEYDRFVASL